MRETGHWKFKQIMIKNKKLITFEVVINIKYKLATLWRILRAPFPFVLCFKKSETFIFPQELFQAYMQSKYNYCKYVSIQPGIEKNYSVINNQEN